ncbi:transmembrane protein [Achlya hypogyna]|uniref:Transmembrane protein n=1 Tax=Achlya hypogyna TaxID=1202772 RepID=A0A1V9Z6Y4_ACHHY|nr:transmembrane protein [Achlya hypogyna]
MANQLEIQNLEELDEFDYDPDFFNGIFPKTEVPAHRPQNYPESPSLAGYTSEESDYSTTTASDASHWSPSSTTSSSSNPAKRVHATMNEGMMTNGKTSLYRGVTRTSKTAWGAKYSSKRIINTCRTQEEAARAYDAYLKENVPDKYIKYANFCPSCDQYTNSLGLAWAKKACKCNDVSRPSSATSIVYTSPAPHKVKHETDNECDPSNQAMEDFMTDDDFTFSSPVRPMETPVAAEPEKPRTPYLSMSSFEVQAKTDDIFIKEEPVPMYRRSSSSLPDDDVLSTLLQATANAAGKTLSPLNLDNTDIFDNISVHSLEARDSLSRLLHASSSFELLDAFQNAGGHVSEFDPQVGVAMETVFLRKYFRNDRKNLQCFPYCREHGNYYEAKMHGLEHAGKGVCRAPVKVSVSHPAPPAHLVVLARCQTVARPLDADAPLSLSSADVHMLQQSWTLGATSDVTAAATQVYFLPEVWKFDAELPKKRRVDDNDSDDLNYFVQVVVYTSADGEHYERAATVASNSFDIQSTRTLLRQKQKKDDEDVLFLLGVPEKKKLRTMGAKFERQVSSIVLETPVDLAAIQWGQQGESFEDFDEEDHAAMEHVEAKTPVKQVPAPIVDAAPKQVQTPLVDTAPKSAALSATAVESEPVTYTRLASPKAVPRSAPATVTADVAARPADEWKTQFALSLVLYGCINLPVGLAFLLVHMLLVPVSIVAFNSTLQLADGIADMDLYFANSLSPREAGHAMLDRVESRGGMARRHLYFIVLKTPINLVGWVGCLVLNLLALLTLVVPPVSRACRGAANAAGMLAVNASKNYCGKPSADALRQPERAV